MKEILGIWVPRMIPSRDRRSFIRKPNPNPRPIFHQIALVSYPYVMVNMGNTRKKHLFSNSHMSNLLKEGEI